ncbi:MAG: zinc-dependent peptidase [Cytophagaceae bacterium]
MAIFVICLIMEELLNLFYAAVTIFTFLVVVFAIIFVVYTRISGRTYQPFTFIKGGLASPYRRPLEKHFRYYQQLSISQKREFERRLNNFIHNKYFIPMHGMKVTAEVKSLISASAIQLTFGLPEIYFVHFTKILVFPGQYYNRKTNSRHKGEVNENGVIAFSWRDFVEGYINHEDTYNVGLHEMAHALSLENRIKNQEYRFFDEQKLRRWTVLADAEFEKLKMGHSSFLRAYAGSNRDEFFPVCIEHFFERPGEFNSEAPQLYLALCDLLNQDPLKASMPVN